MPDTLQTVYKIPLQKPKVLGTPRSILDPHKSQHPQRVTEKVAATRQSHNPSLKLKHSHHSKAKASTSKKGKKCAHDATESASDEETSSSNEAPTAKKSMKQQAKHAQHSSPAVVEDHDPRLDVEQVTVLSRPPSVVKHVTEESDGDQGSMDIEV